ncbi:MAG: cytochrome c3 family protein [Pirellulales bacterium]
MQQRVITVVLLVGLFFGLAVLVSATSGWRLPDNQQGYAPVQPIDYSHRLHAGELQMDCRFCHSAAQSSRYAGIPSSDVCMKCHNFVTAPFDVMQQEMRLADAEKRKPKRIISPELKKLYDSLALNDELQPIEGKTPTSIPWVRVHNLPDYACFNHQAHVTAGVTCQHCHGPVESMERVQQFSTLSMGWCVNCHREANQNGINGQPVHAATDCTVCHH